MTFPHAASLFSSSYATARQRFREAASQLGWTLEAHPIDHKGPDGEDLTIDVAISPGTCTDRVLVLSSGLHGVEGFFGSAVQLDLLQAWAGDRASMPPVRCVFLHALNPYGFAWRRRVNESNVDLNRNLLRAGEAFKGSPAGYAALNGLLNSRCAPSRLELVMLKFLCAIAQHGMPALKQSIASGQYDFPQGLFYGGVGPSRTSEILAANMARWLGDSARVMHLDWHTGLGAWAQCKLLVDYPLGEAGMQTMSRCFGADSFDCTASPELGHDAYATRGSFGQWCVAHHHDRAYLYAAAEFGTYNPLRLLAALRAENQAHHWALPGDLDVERAKRELVECFCPCGEIWRELVMAEAQRLVGRAIKGILQA